MPNRDPFGQAADRAMRNWPGRRVNEDELRTAAREMAKPIRKLHNRAYGYRLPKTKTSNAELFCKHCQVKWPCETAKLIYSDDELKDNQ